MSETQAKVKPSKAAMDLANIILEAARPKVTGDFKQDSEAWPSQGLDVDDMAAIVQSALADLLEKAQTFCETYRAANPEWFKTIGGAPASFAEMESALEPWKP